MVSFPAEDGSGISEEQLLMITNRSLALVFADYRFDCVKIRLVLYYFYTERQSHIQQRNPSDFTSSRPNNFPMHCKLI